LWARIGELQARIEGLLSVKSHQMVAAIIQGKTVARKRLKSNETKFENSKLFSGVS
jgi:hypothetical protein